MRIGIAYDCCYPCTIGGAERWYRSLAEHLARRGHEVEYLTLQAWPTGTPPSMAGVSVASLGARWTHNDHRVRLANAVRFQRALASHVAANPDRYDVIHTSCLPYVTMPALSAAASRSSSVLVVDWWEVLSETWWRTTGGMLGARAGERAQERAARVDHIPLAYAELHASRLRSLRPLRDPVRISGIYEESVAARPTDAPEPYVVYAGRLTADKQVERLIPALELARVARPELGLRIIGDGPERDRLAHLIDASAARGAISFSGFVDEAQLSSTLAGATAMVLPSAREGYGLIVLDAISRGTPAVVARGAESAATERIVAGVNGVIAPSADPRDLAAAMLAVISGGDDLRRSTRTWWAANRNDLLIDHGVDQIISVYVHARGLRR